MATIKVKRSPESKGRCKLAWNKVYNAEINPSYKDSYIIGNNAYLSKWFTPVTDQQLKHKPILKTDPETGKLKVVSSNIRKDMIDIIRTDLNMTAVELFGRLILEGKI